MHVHRYTNVFLYFYFNITSSGEEADVASGLSSLNSDPMESAIQAREQINNLMERCVVLNL